MRPRTVEGSPRRLPRTDVPAGQMAEDARFELARACTQHAPEPSKEPCIEPSAALACQDEAPALDGQGGGPIDEFFTALGPDWRLTAAQRTRLADAVTAALNAGWTPRTLAAITGANTSGVRNPYAVLAARLAPAELPLPYTQPPSRPPWCGQCDERTRLLGFDGDAPRPCPLCKPSMVARRAGPRRNGRLE